MVGLTIRGHAVIELFGSSARQQVVTRLLFISITPTG